MTADGQASPGTDNAPQAEGPAPAHAPSADAAPGGSTVAGGSDAPSAPPTPPADPLTTGPFDIQIRGFSHRYGSYWAVKDLDLAIPRGTITGFIGPNGAGKTTTLLLLCTLLNPTRGDARICGFSCTRQRQRVRQMMGYMPDSFGVYEGLTARDYLRFFAEAYKIERSRIAPVIDEAVELLRIGDKLDVPVEGLSRGQLQRLSLARTLLHDPQVLILDEPAAGLDPLARIELLYILRELRALGKTLFLSSHILSEVSECCDYLAVMSGGKLVAFDRLAAIRHRVRPHFSIELRMQGRAEEAVDALREYSEVASVRANANVIEFDFVGDEDLLLRIHRDLVGRGLPVLFFQPVEVTLEDAFARLLEPQGASAPTPSAPPSATNGQNPPEGIPAAAAEPDEPDAAGEDDGRAERGAPSTPAPTAREDAAP